MLWITESPCAASAARSIAMPARMSGLSTDCPRKAEGPAMTARWGSHNTMRAPMPISLSTKKSRDSNSFSNTSNRPSHWVATTMAMDMRSAGNAGHGPSSSFGTWPPRSGRMRRSWPASTISLSPSSRGRTPSRSNASTVERRSSPRTPSIVIAPPVTAASPMNDPISMWSGPTVCGAGLSGRPPSIVRVLLPMPSMAAPSATRKRARSCTCGSEAALRSTVVPLARTAAISAFSVPVTLGSSRKMSAPLSLPSSLYTSPTLTSAPRRSSARKCVSTRRRPITSPPGGGSVTRPKRASIGPASRIEARISLHSAGSSGFGSARLVSISTVLAPCHCTLAPTCCSNARSVSTSRMRGTLSIRHGPSARSVAARIGRAAFLLPAGRIVPERGRPPVTRNDGGIGSPKLRGRLRLRQAFANVGPRASRASAGASHRRRHRRDAIVAPPPHPPSSPARRHRRDWRADRLARRPARARPRRSRRRHAPRPRADHRARHRMGRRLVRCSSGVAHAATRVAADLARRRRARGAGPPHHRGDGLGARPRDPAARRRVGAARRRGRARPRGRGDHRRQLARPKARAPECVARYGVWGGSRRRGRRALPSPLRGAQRGAHDHRGGRPRRALRRVRAVAGRHHRHRDRDRARGRDPVWCGVQLRAVPLPIRRLRGCRGGQRERGAGPGSDRCPETAPARGDPAVRGLPYYRRCDAAALHGLARAGGAAARRAPRGGPVDHRPVWARPDGSHLEGAALRPAARIRLPRHAARRDRRRAGGGLRSDARRLQRRRRAADRAAERTRRGSDWCAHAVDSRAPPGRGFVMLPTWVGIVSAISLVIIALAALVTAGALTVAALGVRTAVNALKGFAGPAIADVRQLIASIKTEADALVGASRDVRQRIVRAADAAEERLTDLDSLAEVMQEELEDTALDAAATLRNVRRGMSVWRWSRKLMKRKKRP